MSQQEEIQEYIEIKEECVKVTFTYVEVDDDGNIVIKPLTRYIPVDEMHECYFIVCRDEKCPNLKKYNIHPTGMPGCPRLRGGAYTGWNLCSGNGCTTDKPHLYGTHKKCQGSRKARSYNKHSVVPFLRNHVTRQIPANDKVYHFNGWRFNDERSNKKCCCCGKHGPPADFTKVYNFHLPKEHASFTEPMCHDCARLEMCSACSGWGNGICRHCRADFD